MSRPREKKPAHALAEVLPLALPRSLADRLPPPELSRAWRELVGEEVAKRARPVCLESGSGERGGAKQGLLVVAVAGSVWRQEVSLRAPRLIEALCRQGFGVGSIRLVNAPTPPPPAPRPEPRRLSAEEEAEVERRLAEVENPELREALARAMKAQLQAE